MPLNTPFPLIPPELLAQMAAQAFRPPGPMSMSGAGPTPQRPPGFNVNPGDAASGLMGLANWKPSTNPANKPPGMPEPNQYGVPDPEAMQSAYPGGGDSSGGLMARLLKSIGLGT